MRLIEIERDFSDSVTDRINICLVGHLSTEEINHLKYLHDSLLDIDLTTWGIKHDRDLAMAYAVKRASYKPSRVIFNPPATIVFWNDGTKTIVKCREDDNFDEEVGLAMAIAQKVAGDRSKYKKMIKNASRPQMKNVKGAK